MPNPYGRPRTFNTVYKLRIPESIITQIFLAHPELFKPNEPGTFRHGAFSSYITRLLKEDLNRSTGAQLAKEIERLGQLENTRAVF